MLLVPDFAETLQGAKPQTGPKVSDSYKKSHSAEIKEGRVSVGQSSISSRQFYPTLSIRLLPNSRTI